MTLTKRPWLFAGAAVLLVCMSVAAAFLSAVVDLVVMAAAEDIPWLDALVHRDAIVQVATLWIEPDDGWNRDLQWTLPGYLTDWAASNFVNMGAVALCLAAQDNVRSAKLSTVWTPHPYWRFLAVSLLTFLVVVLGTVILIIPGIIAQVLFCFSPFIVIDKGLGPIEAMNESARITKGQRWRVFGFFLLWLLIWVVFAALVFVALGAATILLVQFEDMTDWGELVLMVGTVLVGIGILVLFALAGLSFAHAYRTLLGEAEPVSL